MTAKQQELWNFLASYTQYNRNAPGVSVIAGHFGVSPAAVVHRMTVLERKGRAAKIPGLGWFPVKEDGTFFVFNGTAQCMQSRVVPTLNHPAGVTKSSEDNVMFVVTRNIHRKFVRGEYLEIDCKNKDIHSGAEFFIIIQCGVFKILEKLKNHPYFEIHSEQLIYADKNYLSDDIRVVGAVVRIHHSMGKNLYIG